MDRPRLIRGLRIAWSVLCGILCVLLVVLWVRGYRIVDTKVWRLSATTELGFESNEERLGLGLYELKAGTSALASSGRIELPTGGRFGFGIQHNSATTAIVVPPWFAVLITVLGASAWAWRLDSLPARFSLRTLLITTTLIAVVLGTWAALRL